METKITIKDKSYRIEISEIEANLIKVVLDGQEYLFSQNEFQELFLVDPKTKTSQADKELQVLSADLAAKEIRSPIAGVISNVSVQKGDQVKPGQKVLTLIAMKMENEIIAETSGTVKEIRVKENQFINSGDLLILLK